VLLTPHLGPLGSAVKLASKAVHPHLTKAIGGNFEKGYSLSRFDKSNKSQPDPVSSTITQSSPAHISQGSTPGVKQAISTTSLQPGFRAKISYK
jgi:hypothetical protein